MKTVKYILLSLIIGLSLNACKEKSTAEIPADQVTDEVIKILKGKFDTGKFQTNKLLLQDFTELIELNGVIDVPPKNKASVTTFIEGYVKNANLLVGEQVKKGQYLLAIESPSLIDVQQDYLEVKEQLTYLKNDFERQKTLFEEKISSQKKYLLAKSTYRSSLARFTGLKNKLMLYGINLSEVSNGNFSKMIRINAPMSGTVSKINIVKGDFVSPSQVLLELINNDHMYLDLQAFERDIPQLRKGQKIQFRIPESSQETFLGRIHLLGAMVNQETKTVQIHGNIDDEKKQNLVAGMFVEAAVIVKTIQKLAVPKEAVIKDGATTYVLLLKNKTDEFYEFESFEVTIIQEGEHYTTLKELEQLKEQQILTKGAFMFNTD